MSGYAKKFVRRLRRAFRPDVRKSGFSSFTEVERAERIFYLQYLRDGMIVFDVGANVGELTLLFSRFVCDGGRVHAFEPTRAAYDRLLTVCQAASLRNVTLNKLALTDEERAVRLFVYDDAFLSWTTEADRPLEQYGIAVKPSSTEEVSGTTVDLYCERNGVTAIDLLKIDVEGAEFQVLLGAEKLLLARRVRCLAFEFGQTTFDMGNSPERIAAFLKDVGYEVRNLMPGEPVFPGGESVETAVYSMLLATPKS